MSDDLIDPYITKKLPSFKPPDTVNQIINELTKAPKKWGSLDFIFITEGPKLIGIVPIEDLFSASRSLKISEIMQKGFPTVKIGSDKEKAVALAIRKNMYSLPVVSKRGGFLGIVEPQNLLRILHEENTEDFLVSAGIYKESSIVDTLKARARRLVRLRLPWLLLGLAGGILATTVVSFFEDTLQRQLALAFFIPVIVYMSDAAGTQTETIFIRGLALRRIKVANYLAREILVGLILGFIIGGLAFIFTFLWLQKPELALIVGLAMFLNIAAAMAVAIAIPYLLFKLNKDPAFGSGPFATVVQDIISLVIYFTIAAIILSI